MTDITRNRAGVSLGLLFTVCHALWILLVLTSTSNQVINALAQAHFLAFQYATLAFNPTMAVLGTIGAFATGYLTGWVFAALWNLTGNRL